MQLCIVLLFCLIMFIMKSLKIISKKLKPKIRFLVAVNFFFFLIEHCVLVMGPVGLVRPQC